MTTEEKKKLRKVLEKVFRDTKMWSSEFGANQNIFKLSLEFNGINFGTYRMILRMRGDNPIMALTYVNSGGKYHAICQEISHVYRRLYGGNPRNVSNWNRTCF